MFFVFLSFFCSRDIGRGEGNEEKGRRRKEGGRKAEIRSSFFKEAIQYYNMSLHLGPYSSGLEKVEEISQLMVK